MMNRASAFMRIALLLGLSPLTLSAQTTPRPVMGKLFAEAMPDETRRSSHQRLNGGGLEEMANPEEELGRRLGMRRLGQMKKALNDEQLGELSKLAGKFLQDDRFMESLKGQFTPQDIEQLKEKLKDGNLSSNDKGFRDLIDQIKEKTKGSNNLTDQEKAAVGRWDEDIAKNVSDPNRLPDERLDPTELPTMPRMPSTPSSPSDPTRANDWLKGSLDSVVKNLDQWVDTPSGKSWADTFKNLANRADSGRNSAANLGERTSGISKWMSRISGWNRNAQPPRFGNVSLPNMPRLGTPSGSLPGGALAGSSGVLVVLLGALLLGLLLWRGRDWFASLQQARRTAWKLGPWPVRPEDVTTRADLVRAFEYLALLCLGPAARTCHHLELGQRIGGQPALDAERRQEAAATLSHLYERARYTPDQEPLPGEDLRRARRELAYLAGAKA